jgi:tetratricopeptide (TPR) repeat protein
VSLALLTQTGKVLASEPTAQESFAAGVTAEEKGDVEAARTAYEHALKIEPSYGRALINLGLIEIRHRQVEKGLKRCERAQELDPKSAKVHYCIALGRLREGKDKDAETELERSIALLASDPAPKIELGHLRRKAKRWQDAIQLYREAVRLNADDPDLHVHLGFCYKQLGELKAAEVEYRKAVQKKPESYFGHLDLGWVLVRENQDREAEPHYVKATELKPDAPEPHYNLGNLYKRLGDMSKAKASYQRAVDLDPKMPEYHFELARAEWIFGEVDDAKKHLDLALGLNPDRSLKDAIEKTLRMLHTKPPSRAVMDPTPAGPSAPKEAEQKPGAKNPSM